MTSGFDLLTTREASSLLKIHPNTLRNWEKEGLVTPVKINGKRYKRYKKEELEKLVWKHDYDDKRSYSDLEALLSALNKTAMVSESDTRGNITYVNDKFIKISGFTKSELIGENHRILKSGFHTREFYQVLWKTITSGKVWRGRIKNRTKKGDFYWVDTSIAPIIGESGKPVKYIAVRFPITEQVLLQEKIENINKKLEKRIIKRTKDLQKSEQRFRLMANLLPQLIWTAKPNGVVDYYNDQHKNFDGIKKKNGVFHWAPVIHPDDKKKTLAAWEKAVNSGTTYEVEHRIKIVDKGYRWFLSRGVPVKNEAGEIEKWYGTATDINDQKLALIQKDEFIGVASHELKTPVTSIKVYTQMMKNLFSQNGDAKSEKVMEKMDIQISRLSTLINDLLDVTKIQAGRLELRRELFDFNRLVTETVDEVAITASDKNFIVKLGKNKKVYADENRIGQVIINFLNNAVKYSPNSSRIIVTTKTSKDKVTLCVKDFGLGIPEEKKTNIFNRFYRVAGEKRETYPGLGLGLYISAEIVKRHEGTIWFESKENIGSTFYFSLPTQKQ